MSLRVWLPLNGTLNNQGLDDIVVTNNGATIDNSGKIGKCYSFDGSNDYISFPYSFPSEDWSYSIWFYTTSTNTQTLGCCRNGTGFGFSVFLISNKVRIDGIIGNDNQQWTTTYTYPTNTWINLIVTSKNGLIKYYINGEYQASKNVTINNTKLGNVFTIGASQTNGNGLGNYFKGKINDVRIYDHALSPMEVKQISQGLILHYPLNNNGWGQENLLINSGFFKTSYGWTNNQSTVVSSENNELKVVINQTTSSPGIKATTHFSLNAGIYTASLLIKVENGKKDYISFPFYMNNGSGVIYNGAYIKKEKRGEYMYEEATFTLSSDVENIIFYVLSSGTLNGETWYIKNIKLEKGQKATPWCPNEVDELYNQLGLNNNIQYDTSGYKNNGVKTGTFQYDSDTPKYNVSAIFNGVDNCIQIGNLYSIFSNPFSINLWFKKEVIGSKKYETLIGGASGFEMDTRNGASQTLSLYMASTRGGNAYSPFEFNNWYMVTMVNNGTHELYYINGILTKTIEKKNMPNSNYYIGAWNTPTQQNFKGNMSDFRIYCTALSAEDILSLYNNSAYIDNQGNIYGAIYEEV